MKLKNSNKHSDTNTNWEQLSTMPDNEIDLSDNPELDSSFFDNATLRMPLTKKAVSLRIDSDIINWYKKQGPGYQTRMNAVLRMYMQVKTGSARKIPNKRIHLTGPNKARKRASK